MTISDRYNIQKGNQPIYPCSIDDEIDRYVINMVITRDQRQLLLDKAEYNNVLKAASKDLIKRIEREFNNMLK